MAPAKKATPFVYQLKAMLKGIRPPIWRRIQVTSDANLYHLHRVLQEAMGWFDYHLHEFTIDGVHYADPDSDYEGMYEVVSDKKTKLADVIGPGYRFLYEYDFGDGWEINIVVEKVLPVREGAQYPVCLAGKRSGPPEDCGGVWGYEELLEVIKDPEHPEHEEMLEWLGGEFDPEAFDIEEINLLLKNIKKRAGVGGRQPDVWSF
jgi:hypothetical protein